MDVRRREALRSLVAGTTAVLAAGIGAEKLMAQDKPAPAGGKVLKYEAKPLPFDPAKLNGLSEKLLVSHHANNYSGAVKNFNKTEDHLAALAGDAPGFVLGGVKLHELTYTNSIILHEAYFGNLGGNGKYGDKFTSLISDAFGSVAAWEAQFRATAMSLGGGSGWVILAYNAHTGALRNYWSNHHTLAPAMGIPLIVLDMYEHAYHMDFGAAHAKYVDAFFLNLNTEVVEQRLEAAAKMGALLK